MTSRWSSRAFTILLAGSIVLVVGGLFVIEGSMTQMACIHTNPFDQVASLLGVDYRLTAVSLERVSYYNGCNYGSLTPLSSVPEAVGILSFLTLVSHPAIGYLSGVRNRVTSLLVILGSLGLAYVAVGLSIPLYVLFGLLGYIVIMRSRW